MSTVTHPPDGEVAVYLEEVSARLAGLPETERAELLDDLAQHLAEVMAEPGPALRDRVGPPAAYAAELLASAGMAETRPGPGRRRGAIRTRLGAAARRFGATWAGGELSALRPVLQPTWYVARAYLAVSFLGALGDGSPGFPVPRLLGSSVVGFVAILAAVALSVRLARVELGRRGRWAVRAATAVLVVHGLVLLDHLGDSRVEYVSAGEGFVGAVDSCLRDGAGRPVTNLYAYDAEGRLLDPVLLYDQAGRPVDNLCPELDGRGRRLITEYRRDANGAPVVNAFPRSQSVVTGGLEVPPDPRATSPGGGLSVTTSTVPPPAVVVPRLAEPGAATPTTPTTTPTPTTSPGG